MRKCSKRFFSFFMSIAMVCTAQTVIPNYNNKYPPMGLMKLATYYRMVGDDVRFYKGDMRSLAVELICDDLINHLSIILPEVF